MFGVEHDMLAREILLVSTFELIEDQTIDIDSIEEVNHYDVISAVNGKTEEHINDELELYSLTINELVRSVKHLNKEIQSIKEK